MITEDQTATIEFLAAPTTHGGESVERIDTHASIVFLAGGRAWKLKRAVRYDYLDFSTAARRKAMCEAEVRVNRRTAPSLYRGVVAVVRRADGSLALGGPGEPVDWVVEMNALRSERVVRPPGRPKCPGSRLDAVSRRRDRAVPPDCRAPDQITAARSGMAWVIDGNARGFAEQGRGMPRFDVGVSALTSASHHALARHGAARSTDAARPDSSGECHGDLHLRNIVLL